MRDAQPSHASNRFPAEYVVRVGVADPDDQRVAAAVDSLSSEQNIQVVYPHQISDGERAAAVSVAEALGTAIDDTPSLLAAALRCGLLDAAVVGARDSSASVLRAALRFIGTDAGGVLSSAMLMKKPGWEPMLFADCAVIPTPSDTQLATIAESTFDLAEAVGIDEPRVAMLSFSTHGSADHRSARRVAEATERLLERRPGLAVLGEVQFDAALDPVVRARKTTRDGLEGGSANVFIFPDLNAANIGYKIAERLGGFHAAGPLLTGLNGIFHDLSRGATVADIAAVIRIAAYQAYKQTQLTPTRQGP